MVNGKVPTGKQRLSHMDSGSFGAGNSKVKAVGPHVVVFLLIDITG